MNLMDLISGNGYVGQNFPAGMPPAADGGDDPISKLRQMLLQSQAEKAIPSGAPDAEPPMPMDAPRPIPPAGPLPFSGATEFSARGRDPISVPLPTPRPAGAPLADPADITAFAPTDIQRSQRGMPPIPVTGLPGQPQQANSLLSMIAPQMAPSQPVMNKAMATLGGGLSTVTGNTAGGAFARAMGGGLKAGTGFDKSRADQALKEMKLMEAARAAGDTAAYNKARINYYNVLATQKSQQAAAGGPAAKTARPVDGRLIFDKAERAIQGAYRAIDGDFRLKPEEKAARKAAESARIYKGFGLNPDGTDAGGTKPGKVAGKPSAAPGSEISMQGDGTQGNAYAPNSKDDYDQIESGSYYIHPSSGEIRRKK